MPLPQFGIRTLLVGTLTVAAFFGGMVMQRRFLTPLSILRPSVLGTDESNGNIEILEMPDGTRWFRAVYSGTPAGIIWFPGDHGEHITISTRPQSR